MPASIRHYSDGTEMSVRHSGRAPMPRERGVTNPSSGALSTLRTNELVVEIERRLTLENQSMAQIQATLAERNKMIREISAAARNMRLSMAYALRGAVTDQDRANHRPPRLSEVSENGESETLSYILSTFISAKALLGDLNASEKKLRETLSQHDEAVQSQAKNFVHLKKQEEDEVTVISAWEN